MIRKLVWDRKPIAAGILAQLEVASNDVDEKNWTAWLVCFYEARILLLEPVTYQTRCGRQKGRASFS